MMPGTGKLVLLIDDDATLIRLMKKGLARLGYLVESAATAREGLERIEAGSIDAVVLDHHLPDLDGLQVLQALKEKMPDMSVPIIYLSGLQDPAVAVAAIKAGAADYVNKGVHDDFLMLLDHALRSTFRAVADQKAKELAEAELRQSLARYRELAEERALLIREVHHRVGNSLAIVVALLRMQRATTNLPEASSVLADAEARVQAIANVQSNLYTQDSVTLLRLDLYLSSLIGELRQSLEDGKLEIVLEAIPVAIDADRAVSLGLLVSELLINAKKHAYPEGGGQVRIKLSPGPDGSTVLSVEDDGVGGPSGPPQVSRGVGKRIIVAMATKLGGELKFDPNHKGTRAVLTFQL